MIEYKVPILTDLLIEHLDRKLTVLQLSIEMVKQEGLDKEGRVVTKGDIYYKDLAGFALHNCTFFECFECKEPYYGGMLDCMEAMQNENIRPQDLLCKACLPRQLDWGSAMCELHGNEFIDWKCMTCCNIALFVCFGGTGHYCTPCHNDVMAGLLKGPKTECQGGDDCPLGVPKHPLGGRDPNKSRFPLGCSLCRSEKLARIAENNSAGLGIALERRGSMLHKYGGFRGHNINRQMKIVQAPP